jgi:hypothetical protein
MSQVINSDQEFRNGKLIHLLHFESEDNLGKSSNLINYVDFTLNQDAKDFLRSVERPISVIAMSGKNTYGDSRLINHLIGKTDSIEFEKDSSPPVKGLWIWNKAMPIQTEDGKTINLLFIETKSLGSNLNETDKDERILMLAMLMSSHLVYNCQGSTITEIIDQLNLFKKL